MKKSFQLLLSLTIILFATAPLTGQCEPDTAGCKDVDEPGQICPSQLPDGTLNEIYETVVTVIAPGIYMLEGNPITISYITIDSILNLPEGLTYTLGTDKFWADTADCVLISGTPAEEGEFPLALYLTPWVKFGQMYVPGQQVLDDSSVVITIVGSSGLDPSQSAAFRIIPGYPNPYTTSFSMGFYTPVSESIKLEVYSIVGQRIYTEVYMGDPGKRFFNFNGSDLMEGTYFYKISNGTEIYSGKFIKARR